jgi:hypothetical protein
MNLLKNWPWYWLLIVRVTSAVLSRDRSSHRGTSARHNFCTTRNTQHATHELPSWDEKATVKFIMKVYNDFKQTIVEFNISKAFQALGSSFSIFLNDWTKVEILLS